MSIEKAEHQVFLRLANEKLWLSGLIVFGAVSVFKDGFISPYKIFSQEKSSGR